MKKRSRVALAACALLASACGSAGQGAASDSGRSAGAEADTEYGYVEFDEPITIDQGAAWDALTPTLAPAIGKALPPSSAFGTTWWFDETEAIVAETVAPADNCMEEAAEKPAGLHARFEMMLTNEPELYREGVVELVVLHDADAALVAEYAASRVASVECLATGLSDGISLVRIADGRPEHTTVAYRIDYEAAGARDEEIETSIDLVVVQLHHANTYIQVMAYAIQPLTHPEWVDVEQEALRIAGSFGLDG